MGTSKTALLVRVQARGGKFLADDIGGAEVTVRDAETGEWLGGGVARGTDSGTLSAAYAPTASQCAVVTPGIPPAPPLPPPPPIIQWLVASADTTGITLELDLARPTLLAVAARGPLGGLQSAQRVETTTWALPGQAIDQGPGLVIELPGLVVQVMSPATHLPIAALPSVVDFQVKVTMMCGCQIAPGQPWLPSDFTVTAAVGVVGQPPAPPIPLAFTGTSSIFAGSVTITQPGFYQALVSATQASTGNVGSALVTFYTPPKT